VNKSYRKIKQRDGTNKEEEASNESKKESHPTNKGNHLLDEVFIRSGFYQPHYM
jgi:hypothetical protein